MTTPYDLERFCDELPGIPAEPTRVVPTPPDPPRPRNKLTEAAVRAMRLERTDGASFSFLGKKYDICPEHVQTVCARRSWKWVT